MDHTLNSERLGLLEREIGQKKEIDLRRKFKLDLVSRLLMLLIYYRLCIIFTFTGLPFNIDQSRCTEQYPEPLVKGRIPLPKRVYRETRKTKDVENEVFP